MSNNLSSPIIFIYGPQTSGKSTRLIEIIASDQGNDLRFSGEKTGAIDNGELYVKTSGRLSQLKSVIGRQISRPRHVLIDGVQYLPIPTIRRVCAILSRHYPGVPIVTAGCLYYYRIHRSQIIPASKFMLKWCDRSIEIKRKCRFCSRRATRVLITGDPKRPAKQRHYLVCRHHYYHPPRLPHRLITDI